MKKLVVLTSALVLATSSAWATGIEFVAEGANSEVQTCIDAASGNKSVLQIAEDKGIKVDTEQNTNFTLFEDASEVEK